MCYPTMKTLLAFTLGVMVGIAGLVALQHPLIHIRYFDRPTKPPQIRATDAPIGCNPAGVCK